MGSRDRVLRAAGVVDNQHDVDAVDFQQVDEKAAVTLRIQPHGSHMFSSQGRIGAPRHLRQGLEDSVVLLHEEPGSQTEGNSIQINHSSINSNFALVCTTKHTHFC